MHQAKFTVDTHLFRELGELLVGRDSTALIELIKNAYDADATEVVVHGEALNDLDRGLIQITDNGVGMTTEDFEKGFLRIASRFKDQGQPLSKRYRRRYTGAKGIGRLAAHKLARRLQVYSVPWDDKPSFERHALTATIDWDQVESQETLDDANQTSAIALRTELVPANIPSRTAITLTGLRRPWTATERGRFLAEIQTFSPPPLLIAPLPPGLVTETVVFKEPTVRNSAAPDKGFEVSLTGELEPGEDYWQAVAQSAEWIIEIAARRGQEEVEYGVAPTLRTRRDHPEAEIRRFKASHPDPHNGPFFQARILLRSGVFVGPSPAQLWARRSSGVRLFMEGFRVLPYGEPKNDWLSLDADYARRQALQDKLLDALLEDPAAEDDRDLTALPSRDYFGAVFLTQQDAPSLRMLVNREGFVPDASFDRLVELVRRGIDLSTRVRAAVTRSSRSERRIQRASGNAQRSAGAPPRALTPIREVIEQSVVRAKAFAAEARRLVVLGDTTGAQEQVALAASEIEHLLPRASELITEGAMLRVLASVGTQMAAFIHEITGLLGMTEAIEASLDRIRHDQVLPREPSQQLARLQGAIGDLRRNLERQAAYLVDVVTPDARRRRSRQSLADRFSAGTRLVAHLAENRGIEITNEIPVELVSPPMFPAELTTLFANLLTNSVKAAGKDGNIRATGTRQHDGMVEILIENTGVSVDLADSDRWFRPFESTTLDIDPILGQGMGLGLTITRNMLEQYGAEIKFVQPSPGYSTAVQVVFPQRSTS